MNSITKDINEQIILLRKSGMNIREVAEELSITYDKAKYVLKKAGLQDYKYKRTCEQCNEEFETIRLTSRFCSTTCRTKDYKTKESNKNKQTCNQCGKHFYRYRKQRFCSQSCAGLYGDKPSKPKPIIKTKRKFNCIVCNVEYESQSNRSKFCSYKCRYAYQVEHQPVYDKRCIECGKHYSTTRMKSKYCSKKCCKTFNYRVNETRRREQLRKNGKIDWDISIERLMKRDKNLCYLCGDKVNINLDYNDDYYPNIEHVIPVSKGGTHTWDNVKLSHRICNMEKSDKV